MKIDGNYLYLGGTTYAGNGAVMKLDVSSKSNPIVVETRTTASGGSVTGIAIAGTRIWAADIYNGLFTFDRTAFTVRNSSTAFGVLDVAPHPWGDSFAFAGLAFPDRVLEYYDGASSMSYGDHAAIGDGIRRVAVSGNYGFATASDGDTGQFVSFSLGTTEQGDLVTADTLSSITTGFGSVPENFVIHEGEIAYLASYDGLITVYVDDPTGMSVADRLTMTDEPFDIDGEYYSSSTYYKELLFTASVNGNGKYTFIDIADWTDPQVVDSFDTYTATDPSCIVVAGNYLYTVEQGNRVVIYEIGID